MMVTLCKGKIHRATVTEANLNYEGSITIDKDLIDAAGLIPYEKVQVANISTGARLETYVIEGERGSGMICLNGAAARLGSKGDRIIVIAYGHFAEDEARAFKPIIVQVDENNKIISQ
jgi:aspartate 1-decarboxylase